MSLKLAGNLLAGNLVEVYLRSVNPAPDISASPVPGNGAEVSLSLEQLGFTKLPLLFSHLNFRLLEMLAVTQHGEFITKSKKGKFETIVHLGGHISMEFKLHNQAELLKLQTLYCQIRETDSGLWLSCPSPQQCRSNNL